MKLISKEQERYLWKGLDLENFDVVQVLPQKKNEAAIILRRKNLDRGSLWCVAYRGSGYYFQTYAQMRTFCAARKWA